MLHHRRDVLTLSLLDRVAVHAQAPAAFAPLSTPTGWSRIQPSGNGGSPSRNWRCSRN
jgi:hypothetical protein